MNGRETVFVYYTCPVCGARLDGDDEVHLDDNGDVIACPNCYRGEKVAADVLQPEYEECEEDPDDARGRWLDEQMGLC